MQGGDRKRFLRVGGGVSIPASGRLDLRLSNLKPAMPHWMLAGVNAVSKEQIVLGWEKAGLLRAWDADFQVEAIAAAAAGTFMASDAVSMGAAERKRRYNNRGRRLNTPAAAAAAAASEGVPDNIDDDVDAPQADELLVLLNAGLESDEECERSEQSGEEGGGDFAAAAAAAAGGDLEAGGSAEAAAAGARSRYALRRR